jgi:hypothetical protein
VWDRNRFTEGRPALRAAVESPYARGAVTGVGVITALAGLAELAAVITARTRRQTDLPPGESHKTQAG